MTDQEAEAFAARLTRIWVEESNSNACITWYLDQGELRYTAKIAEDVELMMGSTLISGGVGFHFKRTSGTRTTGRLFCPQNGVQIYIAPPDRSEASEGFEQFAQQYLPFFRRNCWLSGCPIEASAHEKAEWIQGFSREELEAWNLKM